jgi:hypothetical protein
MCGKEYLEKENFNWSCRTHRVIILIFMIVHSPNLVVKCGGVVEKPPRKPQVANLLSMRARRMKMRTWNNKKKIMLFQRTSM